MRRIVALFFDTLEARVGMLAAFREAMRDEGFEDGRDYALEPQFAGSDAGRMAALAAEAAQSRPALILAAGTLPATAAFATTREIPIVMVGVGDPQARGLIAGFERPGGNVTGSSDQSADAFGERLAYARQLLPGMRRLALVGSAKILPFDAYAAQAAAADVRLEIEDVPMPGSAFDEALARVAGRGPDAVFVWPSPASFGARRGIAERCLAVRLPLIFGWVEFMDAPALAACGPNLTGLYRVAAPVAAQVLRGRAPADIPAVRPVFERVLNLDVARLLGIEPPPEAVAASTSLVNHGERAI